VWKYIYGDIAAMYEQRHQGGHAWHNASSGSANSAITFNEALRLDTSGRLGIGTSSPQAKLQIGASTAAVGLSPVAYFVSDDHAAGSAQTEIAIGQGGATTGSWVGIGAGVVSGANPYFFIKTRPDAGGTSVERLRIDGSGRLLVGTSSGNANGGILQLTSGITFPATAVAASDANTLDDYEEGTFTPTQGTGVTVVGAFSSVGSYVKIGKQVSFAGYIIGATSVAFNPAGGNLAGGLPFSVLAGIGCGVAQNSTGSVMIIAIPGGTGISGQSSIAATGVIYFSGTYPT
jgi:hypothetical protein